MTQMESITEFMLKTFAENKIEDTFENRYTFLVGMYDAWKDIDEPGAASWKLTLLMNITMMRINQRYTKDGA